MHFISLVNLYISLLCIYIYIYIIIYIYMVIKYLLFLLQFWTQVLTFISVLDYWLDGNFKVHNCKWLKKKAVNYYHIIPRHTLVAGYYSNTVITAVFRVSVRLSISPHFRFWMLTWVNINGFTPNLVYALILQRSALGLLMGKFRQFWQGYLPATCP